MKLRKGLPVAAEKMLVVLFSCKDLSQNITIAVGEEFLSEDFLEAVVDMSGKAVVLFRESSS